MTKEIVYRICFQSNDQVYELYAKSLTESEMFGFIEVEEIVFGESSAVIVDPNDEKLRAEFAGVKRTFIPLHHIMRIDALEKEGEAKKYPASKGANIRILPTGMVAPKNDSNNTPQE